MNETMTARELDAWLAEHLFGLSVEWHHGQPYAPQQLVPTVKPYSSTGEGMLMVIEAMRERGLSAKASSSFPISGSGEAWAVQFDRYISEGSEQSVGRSISSSLPRAVAEAARAAIEAEA